ncbi:MAG TPA: helix-turn-helix domain-containing protein [Candidatus Limnocylindrales bacterium]|nr:helix-turn-helix domain-containing protein [Candidatus Limnocylindrales bacterium]
MRFGSTIRLLRRRRGWRQSDLAGRSGVSQATISRLERGHVDSLALGTVRVVLAGLDVRLDLQPRWRGGELDRLLDAEHGALVGRLGALLPTRGWLAEPEVAFAVYGERGSFDLLAFHPATAALLVVEVKTMLASTEEMLRRLDVKARLAPGVARSSRGWQAAHVSRLLVLPERKQVRLSMTRHRAVLDAALPARAVEVRQWLRQPAGSLRGLWVLADIHPRTAFRDPAPPARVRIARGAAGRGG